MEEEKAREAIVPQPGAEAPDFVAEVLDRDRKRTGETVRLSDLRGKPVGIVFGSYT
jgi:peroxiredoxin